MHSMGEGQKCPSIFLASWDKGAPTRKRRARKRFLIDRHNSKYMLYFFLYFPKEVKKERIYKKERNEESPGQDKDTSRTELYFFFWELL